MGTEKRERQKAGRQARVEAAREAQRKAEGRHRLLLFGGIILFVAAVIGIFALIDHNKKSDSTASSSSSSSTTATTAPAAASAAGKDCVALADPLPTGAPDVPITPGPPPTSLVSQDLVEGTGDTVPEGATVTVDYIGVSCSTGKIFDSSYSRGQPATFGLDQVIPGWTTGIPGMKVGGQRLLIIPPDLAYGSTGHPPTIAPDETLYFVVTVNSVEAATTTTAAP